MCGVCSLKTVHWGPFSAFFDTVCWATGRAPSCPRRLSIGRPGPTCNNSGKERQFNKKIVVYSDSLYDDDGWNFQGWNGADERAIRVCSSCAEHVWSAPTHRLVASHIVSVFRVHVQLFQLHARTRRRPVWPQIIVIFTTHYYYY